MEGSGGAGARGRAVFIVFLTAYMQALASHKWLQLMWGASPCWRREKAGREVRRGWGKWQSGAYHVSDPVHVCKC